MQTESLQNVRCVTCAILAREVGVVLEKEHPDIKVTAVDSTLHIYPKKLEKRLASQVQRSSQADELLVLVYGDCHAGMLDMESSSRIARVRGSNCCEILLGREDYRRLRSEGAFFLLPDWTARWKHVFKRELGLSRETAQVIMREAHKTLIYLDTGMTPVPKEDIQAIEEFTGLRCEILPVSLDHLRAAIFEAIGKLASHERQQLLH